MKAFVLHGKEDLRRADLARPTAQAEQVIVQVRRAGICGSDMHYYLHGRVGRFVPNRPFVLGHEFAGEVVELGGSVDGSWLGKRVTVDPSIPCTTCEFCRQGRYNLCLSMRFYGSASCDPHLDGGLSEFVAVPRANCFPLPDSVTWGEAALIEPLSVAVHAVFRAGRVAGSSVLVTGGGPIGQFVALVAKAFGAAQVVLSDVANYQRQKALEFGVEAVLDGTSASFEAQAIELSRGGFDIAIEAAGAARALQQALAVARRGATIVQVGTLPPEVTLPLNDVMARELNLVGSFRFANVFGIALDLVSSGRVHIAPCVSAVLPLDSAQTAMQRAIAKLDVIKVQVEP